MTESDAFSTNYLSSSLYLSQKSGNEVICIISRGSVCLHLQGETKTPWQACTLVH